MREIKFKVWDEVNNRFIGFDELKNYSILGFDAVNEVCILRFPENFKISFADLLEEDKNERD